MIRILKKGEVSSSEIFSRVQPKVDVESIVSDIILDVRSNGDQALLAYCEKFDGAKLSSLEVTKEEIDDAFDYHHHLKNVDVIFDRVGLGEKDK